MTINRDVLAIDADLDRLLAVDLDEQEALLVAAFADVLRITRQEAEAIAGAMVDAAESGRSVGALAARDERVALALTAIREAVDTALTTSLARVRYSTEGTVQRATTGAQGMVAGQLTGALRAELASSVVGASPVQVQAIVERTTQRIVSQTQPLAANVERAMRRELRRGVAVGENPRQVARRMVRSLEDATDLQLSRAMTIARTETIDAHRAGGKAVETANADVLDGWEWYCHADERTCPACVSMHGERFPTEQTGPEGHPNCRCGRIPVTKSWADLGFPGVPEPDLGMVDAGEWFDGLTEQEQRSMLGVRGFDAWQAGTFPIEQWSTRRSTDGWRDSIAPSKPPKETT